MDRCCVECFLDRGVAFCKIARHEAKHSVSNSSYVADVAVPGTVVCSRYIDIHAAAA